MIPKINVYNLLPASICMWIIVQTVVIIKKYKAVSKNLYLAAVSGLTIAIMELPLSLMFLTRYVFLKTLYLIVICLILGVWVIPSMPALGITSLFFPIVIYGGFKIWFTTKFVRFTQINDKSELLQTKISAKDITVGDTGLISVSGNEDSYSFYCNSTPIRLENILQTLNKISILGLGPKLLKADIYYEKDDKHKATGSFTLELFKGIKLSEYLKSLNRIDDARKITAITDKITSDCAIAQMNGIYINTINADRIRTKNKLVDPQPHDFFIVEWSESLLTNSFVKALQSTACEKIKF